tara:strand:- start:449 stop:634 length:186 start_codon:yes stop_codon:yes gene_type:complete
MRDKIESIVLQYSLTDSEASQLTDELLNLFPVIKCRCIHEIEERFPSELINKKCNDFGGVL